MTDQKLIWEQRVNREKRVVGKFGEEISDAEAHARVVARMHPPRLKRLYQFNPYRTIYDPQLYKGATLTFDGGTVSLPNCIALEPAAVHASRSYKNIVRETVLMIQEGRAQPGELRLLCSEFLIFQKNGQDFLVRYGNRRLPLCVSKENFRISYTQKTVWLHIDARFAVKSPGRFEYYLSLHWQLDKRRHVRAWDRFGPAALQRGLIDQPQFLEFARRFEAIE